MKIFLKTFVLTLIVSHLFNYSQGQSTISFHCKELNLSKSESLKCDPISEDDPNDLSEAYSYLVTFFPANKRDDHQRFEFRFPAHPATYHWAQKNGNDKNDSLSAYLAYNLNPNVDGQTFQAYAKDFTIKVSRYDSHKGGIIEGSFDGTMESYLPWSQQTVTISVKGNFSATRTGKGDECRKQRRSEKAVISKAVKVFENAFIPFLQKAGWQIENETNGYNTQIANHSVPFRPLFTCSDFFHLKLSLNGNSALGKMIHDSAEYYGNQGRISGQQFQQTGQKKYVEALNEATRKMAQFTAMQNMEISIDANDPYLKSGELGTTASGDHFTVLHIPGVAYACQGYRASNDEMSPPEEKVKLCFGNWKGADLKANTYVAYPFVHKQQSAVIENFVVTITSPSKNLNDIIKKIDWDKLNEALTK